MACFTGTGSLDLAQCFLLRPGGPTVAQTFNEPSDIVNLVVSNIFVLAGVLLFGMIILAGFKFSLQGPKGKDEGKTILQAVVMGFLVMFSAYWIVRVIELLIGDKILL